MSRRNRCRKFRKIILTMAEDDRGEATRRISEHLSECEACRALQDGLHKMEQVLVGSKPGFDEVARRNPVSWSRAFREGTPRVNKRLWRLRPMWAGAAALLLVVAAVSVLLLRGREAENPKGSQLSAPWVTQGKALVASSQTLRELAEVLCRHEAPSLWFPHSPAVVSSESFVPQSVQRYSLEAEDTLRTIAELTANLTRRKES